MSSVGDLLIPVATAGLGGFLLGPWGAQLGWLAGSVYTNSQQTIRQPAIGDLRIQTAQYGVPIAFVVGKGRLPGTIIWATAKQPYTIKQKTSSLGPTIETTAYKQSFAILICKGPIVGIRKMWINNTLFVDGNAITLDLVSGGSGYSVSGTYTDVPLLGGSGREARATLVVSGGQVTNVTITFEGVDYAVNDTLTVDNSYLGGVGSGFSAKITSIATGVPLPGTLYLGTDDQMPDPTMVSHLGSGNVPAYRGRAYIVMKDFDLGPSGVMPTFEFEVLGPEGF